MKNYPTLKSSGGQHTTKNFNASCVKTFKKLCKKISRRSRLPALTLINSFYLKRPQRGTSKAAKLRTTWSSSCSCSKNWSSLKISVMESWSTTVQIMKRLTPIVKARNLLKKSTSSSRSTFHDCSKLLSWSKRLKGSASTSTRSTTWHSCTINSWPAFQIASPRIHLQWISECLGD